MRCRDKLSSSELYMSTRVCCLEKTTSDLVHYTTDGWMDEWMDGQGVSWCLTANNISKDNSTTCPGAQNAAISF